MSKPDLDIEVKELEDGSLLVGMPQELWQAVDRDRRYLGLPSLTANLTCALYSFGIWHRCFLAQLNLRAKKVKLLLTTGYS